ncbi:carboxymuconolactone decarboxylase family protein [Pseudomonas sp. C2B4]|uniref:carboxymuconolactone decarboxylase family protein n=1 Tax=Pseudomonas sp. C2B4 TaxID=2735270 RepID=UPI0015862545|nr:carboxymuconolactone decarboxylase family protein [Pseudomonas sp. C2B4]NUU38463.1 carboxymuconolactone decarboxylase family protein [Pseudomonas sp. C2B4]
MTKKREHKTYENLKRQYPDYLDAVEALGTAVRHAGPLDEKTVQLIQLGAAASIRSEGAVHSHTRRAREAGATPEQIRHALIALTSTIGFPTVVAAISWADDVMGEGQSPAV